MWNHGSNEKPCCLLPGRQRRVGVYTSAVWQPHYKCYCRPQGAQRSSLLLLYCTVCLFFSRRRGFYESLESGCLSHIGCAPVIQRVCSRSDAELKAFVSCVLFLYLGIYFFKCLLIMFTNKYKYTNAKQDSQQ